MYELYTWYPWEFGRWVYRGEAETKEGVLKFLDNKNSTTYKVVKDGVIVEFNKKASYRNSGMVHPETVKVGDPDCSD